MRGSIMRALVDGNIIMLPQQYYGEGMVLDLETDEIVYISNNKPVSQDDFNEIFAGGNGAVGVKIVARDCFQEQCQEAFLDYFFESGTYYEGPGSTKCVCPSCLEETVMQTGEDQHQLYCYTCDEMRSGYEVFCPNSDVFFVPNDTDSSLTNSLFYMPGGIRAEVWIVKDARSNKPDAKAGVSIKVVLYKEHLPDTLFVANSGYLCDDRDDLKLDYRIDGEYLNVWINDSKNTGVQIKVEDNRGGPTSPEEWEGIVLDWVMKINGQDEIYDEIGWLSYEDIAEQI